MENNSEKIERVLADVALENSLQHRTVRDVYEKLWKSVRYFMSLDEMPRIIIRNFATLEPSIRNIEKQLRKIKEKEENGIEVRDKEERVKKLEAVKERLIKERESRRHSTRKSSEVRLPDSDS